jgi:hypothetical protein
VGLDALTAAARARADLRELALRIFHDADPALGHGFDARITLRTRDGRTLTATADAAALDRERLAAKFVANAAPLLGALPARDAAWRLSAMEAPDPAAIAGLFAAR